MNKYIYNVMMIVNNQPQTVAMGVDYDKAITTLEELRLQHMTAYVWKYRQGRTVDNDKYAQIIKSCNWYY